MYAKVNYPKGKITKEWSDRAFAPLIDYLEKFYPEDKDKIMVCLTFMGNEEGKFHYKHRVNKSYIVFDQAGALVSMNEDALNFHYKELFPEPVIRKPIEDRFIHPNAALWVDRNLKSKLARRYREEVLIFLQEIWGPFVNYDYGDLKVGYPVRKHRDSRCCLYVYPTKYEKRIVFQVIGDEIVERSCTRKQYNDYLWENNWLTLEDWKVIGFTREDLDSESPDFREFVERIIEIAEWRDPVYELNYEALKDMNL